MGLYDKTDNYDNLCPPGPSGNTRSELNHILEINESHADNFILVIPRLPIAQFISSYFNEATNPKSFFEIDTPSSSGTSGTSGSPNDVSNSCDSAAVTQEQIHREENLDVTNFRLFITSTNLPNVGINTVTLGTQFADINRASKIQFGDLTTNMLISQNLINYNIIYYWMMALHNPIEYNKMTGKDMITTFFTEIHLIITNNHREKVSEFQFIDAFPSSISPLALTYQNSENLTADVTWKHSGMVPSDNFVLKYV